MRWIEITIVDAWTPCANATPQKAIADFGIQLRRSPKRMLGLFVIETENECEPLIEKSLRLMALRGDRVMMRAQTLH